MQIFVYGFVSVISLVSITNIVNTISTNINLRKKELAIISSIGVTPQGFNKMIYLESFLYGALSLIYGIPIGIGLITIMNKTVSEVIEFGLILPWEAIGVCIVGTFVITFIASYVPMKKINKENIVENIRQESI
jgi:putative ABC transport system permease protein